MFFFVTAIFVLTSGIIFVANLASENHVGLTIIDHSALMIYNELTSATDAQGGLLNSTSHQMAQSKI